MEFIGGKELKEIYNFVPPQSYAYDSRYEKLTNAIKNTKEIPKLNKHQ